MKKFVMLGVATAALYTTAPAMAAEKMVVNLCTGGESRPYHMTGEYIAGFLKDNKNITVRVINTNGTWDNIERTVLSTPTADSDATGETCHAMIGQPDGAVVLKRKNPAAASKLRIIGQGPVEYLHVLCNKESGVDDLKNLGGDNSKSVALGPEGSGAWLIWENFKFEDASYKEVQVTDEDGASGLASVAAGDTTCMLVPGALGHSTILQADEDFGDQLTLAGANDWDFNDATDIDGKKRLYTFKKIPSRTYAKNLQGFFSGTTTVAWQANIYVNKDHFRNNQKALDSLITAIAKAKPAIKKTFGDLD